MTRRRMRALSVLASSLAPAARSRSRSGLADVVTLTPDAATKGDSAGKVRGTVVAESPTKVEVKLGTSVTSIPTNEIASIDYDNDPPSLESARTKEAANALAEAADLYKKAAAEASTKPFIAEDAAFGQVRVIAELALDRAGQDRRGHRPARNVLPDLQERPAHRPGPRIPGQAPARQGELHGARADAHPALQAPRRRRPGLALSDQDPDPQGVDRPGHRRTRQGHRRRPRRLGQAARRPDRQGRKPGLPEEIQATPRP